MAEKIDRPNLRHKLYYGEHIVDALDEAEKIALERSRSFASRLFSDQKKRLSLACEKRAIENYKAALEGLLDKV